MNASGGFFGMPATTFYHHIVPKDKVGVARRTSSCEWTLEQRGMALPSMPFVTRNTTPDKTLHGQLGVVWALSNPADPFGTASCLFANRRMATLRVSDMAWDGDGLPDDAVVPTGTFPGPVCPFRWYRRDGAAGSAFDLLREPHTDTAMAAMDPELRRAWGSAAWKWCMPPSQAASHIRACGYSANIFPAWSVAELIRTGRWPDQSKLTYPAQRRPVGVWVIHSAKPRTVNKKKRSTPEVRYRHLFQIHTDDPHDMHAATTTATSMGWSVQMGKGNLSSTGCARISHIPVFFTGRAKFRKLLRYNVGHWLHDIFFYLFSSIANHLPMSELLKGRYEVIMPPFQWELVWSVIGIKAGRPDLLESLAPVRPIPPTGMCYSTAYIDCPAANSMRPVGRFQEWLRLRHGMPYQPMKPSLHPRLMFMIRQRGSDRYISNWRTLVALARDEGWEVDVPMSDGKGRSLTSAGGQLLALMHRYQHTHATVAFHGTEVATSIFMPNGSVSIEILAGGMRYLDQWFPQQAQASGIHFIRWIVPNTMMDWAGNELVNESGIPRKCFLDATCLRTTLRTTVRPPPVEWVQLLNFTRALVGSGPRSG